MIRELEEIARAAWPAARSVEHDGWILCESGGHTRRTNSVQPVAAGALGLAAKIAHCELFYREHGRRAVFKLTTVAEPRSLDAELERRGYASADPTSVQLLDLAGAAASLQADPVVAIDEALDDAWWHGRLALTAVAPHDAPALRGILERVVAGAEPAGFASVTGGGRVVAQGLCVLRRGHAFLAEIATAPEARGRGLAGRVVASLLSWARERGAERALLQVVAANSPARAVYARLGFEEAYRYWYREAALSPRPAPP